MLELIRAEIARERGFLPFDRYMELALYCPGLGYYRSHPQLLGRAGDFVTAPEISPVFAGCLANQVAQILSGMERPSLLEFGAGSGRLASDLLLALNDRDALPERYLILEISAALAAGQRELLSESLPGELFARVVWLTELPEGFCGVMLANEVVDAMPVSRFALSAGQVLEYMVGSAEDGSLYGAYRPAQTPGLVAAVTQRARRCALPDDGYHSEVNLRAGAWLRALAERLERGVLLLLDYGYNACEYYHPDRTQGTLMCYRQHRAFDDPLRDPGEQDITAHVDFSALAEHALAVGLEVLGYAAQGSFLMAAGLDRVVAGLWPADASAQMQLTQGVKRLTLPEFMGEQFKVLALGKGVAADLDGFAFRNMAERLWR